LAKALIQGDEQGYFADKAYSGQAFREALERRGLIDGAAWRGWPLRSLEDWQRLLNSWPSSIRFGVERAHATMKQWYGMSRVRYRGLARNACHLQFVVTAMNMKRARAHGAKLRTLFPADPPAPLPQGDQTSPPAPRRPDPSPPTPIQTTKAEKLLVDVRRIYRKQCSRLARPSLVDRHADSTGIDSTSLGPEQAA
jgi:hypothetical protein